MARSKLYPVVLFAFKRPQHTRTVIESLLACPEADRTTLYVFCDAARTKAESSAVNEVRSLLRSVQGFRRVEVVIRNRNYGLAKNISDGLSAVFAEHDAAVVVEDDTVVSPVFLRYMNRALDHYRASADVWHINGWAHPIPPPDNDTAYLSRLMICWGWATWADRWEKFERDPTRLMRSWSKVKIKRFNLDSSYDYWSQVTRNASGELDTWAIFWYATIFEHDGLCLFPPQSYVSNIGRDGTGENCGTGGDDPNAAATSDDCVLPTVVRENMLQRRRIVTHMRQRRRGVLERIMRKLDKLANRWR